MSEPIPRLYYDLVDPLSWLVERELSVVERDRSLRVVRLPFELRPPPRPLIDPDDPEWRERWSRALEISGGDDLRAPPLVPWTRKAHELTLHVAEQGDPARLRDALYQAVLRDRLDIGRVDVLVELGVGSGLDLTRTKAVLDVDRHAASVEAMRADALARGVRDTPVLEYGRGRLEGFHNRDVLRTFLAADPSSDPEPNA